MNAPASPSLSSLPVGEWITGSEEETFKLGQVIGQHLAGGEVLRLDGALGAGKTVFVKGLATALGISATEVTSPSFTLVNRYENRLTLYHLDLYRLNEGAAAAHAVDLDELLADARAVIVIEWAARLKNYPLPTGATWQVSIDGDGETARRICVSLCV